jgi:hypothetical protein
MTLRIRGDTGKWKRKLQLAVCARLVLEEAMDLSHDFMLNAYTSLLWISGWPWSTSASVLHCPLYHPTTYGVIGFFYNTVVWSHLITSRVTNFKLLNEILSHFYGPTARQYNSNCLCCGKPYGVGWRIANKITTQYCSLLQNMNQTQPQWLLYLPPTWTLSKQCTLLKECICFSLTGFFRTINDFPNDINRLVFVIGTPSSCNWDPYLLNITEPNIALQGVNHPTVCTWASSFSNCSYNINSRLTVWQ